MAKGCADWAWKLWLCRFIHSRLRTHAESVAFFGGGSREQAVSSKSPIRPWCVVTCSAIIVPDVLIWGCANTSWLLIKVLLWTFVAAECSCALSWSFHCTANTVAVEANFEIGHRFFCEDWDFKERLILAGGFWALQITACTFSEVNTEEVDFWYCGWLYH